jgi:hypothetical protein
MVAPFAVVTLDQMEMFENGSRSEPSVEPHIFGLDGRKLNVEEHYGEMVDDEGMAVLRKLRTEVVRVLNGFAIAVIPEEDLDKPVPWLRAGDEVFLGEAGEPITVRRHSSFRDHRLDERRGTRFRAARNEITGHSSQQRKRGVRGMSATFLFRRANRSGLRCAAEQNG